MNFLRKAWTVPRFAVLLLGLAAGCSQKDELPTSTTPAPKGSKPQTVSGDGGGGVAKPARAPKLPEQ